MVGNTVTATTTRILDRWLEEMFADDDDPEGEAEAEKVVKKYYDVCRQKDIDLLFMLEDVAFSHALAKYDSCINDADQQLALIFLNIGHYDD